MPGGLLCPSRRQNHKSNLELGVEHVSVPLKKNGERFHLLFPSKSVTRKVLSKALILLLFESLVSFGVSCYLLTYKMFIFFFFFLVKA